MELEEFFQRHLTALMNRALVEREVADRLGLERIREPQEGSHNSHQPGWQLWLRDRPGVYELELAEARFETAEQLPYAVAQLVIRYIPAPEEEVLASFGFQERALVATGVIGPNGASHRPSLQLGDGGLYAAGFVELALAPDTRVAVLAVSSLDRLRLLYPKQAAAAAPDGTPAPGGPIGRDVPGTLLAQPVLATLAGMLAFTMQTPPSRVMVTREPGFVFHLRGGHDTVSEDDPGRYLERAAVAFGPAVAAAIELVSSSSEGAQLLVDWQTPAPRPVFPGDLALTEACWDLASIGSAVAGSVTGNGAQGHPA